MQTGWVVVVRGHRIEAAGPRRVSPFLPARARSRCRGRRCCRGSSKGTRICCCIRTTRRRGTIRSRASRSRIAWRARSNTRSERCMAGITTVRDLGTEGAGYADVGLKRAIDEGIVPGPRMIVAGPAMVATGTYGPKGYAPEWTVPQGAQEASGLDEVTRVARDQIGRGADFIKVYADYRCGPNGEARPTFTLDELRRIVEVAQEQRPAGRRARVDARRHAPRDRSGRRNHRARRRRHAGDLEADGRAPRRLLSDGRGRRCDRAVRGLEEGRRSGAGAHRRQAPVVQGGARCRRDDVLRRRRRRVRARRQRARARDDGGLRDALGRRRFVSRPRSTPACFTSRIALARSSRACSPI